jgi:hypothetical protein
MSLRVTLYGKVNPGDGRSRSESESEKGAKESCGVDPKPSDLPMARVKFW